MKSAYENIDNIEQLKLGDHSVLLYEDEAEIIDRSISFIRSSLKRDEKCIYIKGDANTELLMKELRSQITGIDEYLADGQLQILSSEETYALSNSFKAEKMISLIKKEAIKSLKEGYNGLSITGELSWVLNFEGGKEEIIEYEWKLNELVFGKYPVLAMCRYNINKFDDSIIKAIIELHHYIIWKGKAHENPYYIKPDGYRDNKIVEYEISTWLKNIQEYKKREGKFKEKIKEKEIEYQFLFNQINDAVYLHKIKANNEFGNFIKVNNKASKMLGYTKEELLEMSPKDIDAPEFAEKVRKQIAYAIPFTEEIVLETKHRTSSGEVIPVELNICHYQNNGDSYLLTIARDITDRKKKENELLQTKKDLEQKNEQLEVINATLDQSIKNVNELNQRYIKMIELFANKDNLNYGSEKHFLENLLNTAIEVIPEADYGSIYNYKAGKINFINCVGHDKEELNKIDIPAATFFNQYKDVEIINFREMSKRAEKYIEKNELAKLKKQKFELKEIMQMDLEVAGEKRASLSLEIDSKSKNKFTIQSLKTFRAFHNLASIFYSLDNYNNLQKQFTKELVSSIVKLLEMYDLYTKGHSENVADLASKIAEKMELSPKEINEVYWAGLVHDLGKLILPIEILNKKTSLSDKEYELVQKHPIWGSQALENSETLQPISKYIRYHHERWDGRGYPEGLTKKQIPLISQILQVADSWDAMRSQRAYRDALEKEKAIKELKVNKGTQFSPEVIDVFLQIIE